MWLALDADGVLQRGKYSTSLFDSLDVADVGDIHRKFIELETTYLTRPGFGPALMLLCRREGFPDTASSTLLRRHVEIELDNDLLEALGNWRMKFDGIALATNQVAERLSAMLQSVYPPGFFDAVVASCVLSVAKPDLEYFTRLVSQLGVPPSEVWFLDDRGSNVRAARESGLRADVFHRFGGRREFERLLSVAGNF